MVIGLEDVQIAEERLTHVAIIVLAGVNEDFLVVLPQLARDQCRLDELRLQLHCHPHLWDPTNSTVCSTAEATVVICSSVISG